MQEFRHHPSLSTSSRVLGVRRATWRFILIGGGVIVLLIGAGMVYYQWSVRPVVDRRVIDQAGFVVYAPTTAPRGYSVRNEATAITGDTLTYTFSGTAGDADITVTVQPRPSGFNMKQITEGGSVNSTATPNGTLYDLSAGNTSKYLLDTTDSLVFITSAQTVTAATVNDLAASLRRYN